MPQTPISSREWTCLKCGAVEHWLCHISLGYTLVCANCGQAHRVGLLAIETPRVPEPAHYCAYCRHYFPRTGRCGKWHRPRFYRRGALKPWGKSPRCASKPNDLHFEQRGGHKRRCLDFEARSERSKA